MTFNIHLSKYFRCYIFFSLFLVLACEYFSYVYLLTTKWTDREKTILFIQSKIQ